MIYWYCSGAVNRNQLCRTSVAMVLFYKLHCSAQLKLVIVQCQASWFKMLVWFLRPEKISDNLFWGNNVHLWYINQWGLKWAGRNVLDLENKPEMRQGIYQVPLKSVLAKLTQCRTGAIGTYTLRKPRFKVSVYFSTSACSNRKKRKR